MAKSQLFVDRNVTTGNLWQVAAAALTASSAASALPATNTQNPDRTKTWQSAQNTTTQYIDIDLGASYAATGVAIANLRLLGAGALKLQQRGTSGSPGAAVDVATLPAMDARTQVTYVTFGTVTARHWRLLWTNPTSASDYASAGYVFLGQYYETTVNPSSPLDLPRLPLSTARTSDYGQKTFQRKGDLYTVRLQYRDLPEADSDAIRAIYEIVQVTAPFFYVLDNTRGWQSWLVRMSGFTPGISRGYGRFNQDVTVEEAL